MDGQQRRERKGKAASVCCTFGVEVSQVLVGARRIQTERILGFAVVDVTSVRLGNGGVGSEYAKGIGAGCACF